MAPLNAADDEVVKRQLDYWRRALKDAPIRLDLPADRPRPAQPASPAASVPFRIDASTARALKSVGQKHDASLFMTLLAGWAGILGRLAGQDDLIIGTSSANEDRGETSSQSGGRTNILALRIDLSGSPSVSELLERVRDTTLSATAGQDVSFEQVIAAVQPAGVSEHSPLFQVMFAWRDCEADALDQSRARGVFSEGEPNTTAVDLELSLTEVDEAIVGALHYAAALFDRATVERHCGYLEAMLKGMIAQVDQPVSRIDVLSDVERTLLLETWNATQLPYPADRCIHELFEEQVRRTPDATALVFRSESLDYAQLNAKANRLAYHLRECGVVPDSRVAICVERSVAMVIGMLAVLKAGGAYVPLDPSYPVERLGQVLHSSQPVLLLSDAVGRQALRSEVIEGLRNIELDTMTALWERLPVPDVNLDAQTLGLTSRHLAYVIYTSGSTGTPKGVMVEHCNVVNLLCWSHCTFAPEEMVRTLFSTSISFDISIYECFVPLTRGATVNLVNNALSLTDADQCVSIINTVPSAITTLLDVRAVTSGAQTINLAGEPLKRTLIKRIFDETDATQVYNLYGPSETTVYSTSKRTRLGDAITESIGRPIANTRIYLLDEHARPVPLGVVGELYIGGAGVARGYLNRPDLTGERFLHDPFSAVSGARMYRTGDLACYLPNGDLEYRGRNDDQVKIRGFRIEPGEIERTLCNHPAVREAVVIPRMDASSGDKQLIAYVVPAIDNHEGGALVTSWRDHLAALLPEYMIPAAFVRLTALPLMPNGKLDRRVLPAPDAAAYARGAYEAPQGMVEQTLAELWQTLLKMEQIGRHENFFELGGHSLLGLRLLGRLPEILGVSFPLSVLFNRPNIAALAEAVEERRAKADEPASQWQAIEPVTPDQPLVLSFAQQRLWFLDQLGGVNTSYLMPFAVRLKGALNVSALCRALDGLFARHDVLRSTFVAEDGRPFVQLLPAASGLPLRQYDLRSSDDPEAEVERVYSEDARTPFDLARGPLIRAHLMRIRDQEYVFLLTQHHIVSDGWSTSILTRELGVLYAGSLHGLDNPLPPLAIQYPDYAAWQHVWLSDERLRLQTEYWQKQLSGAPALLTLPTDRARPSRQSFKGASVAVQLDAALTAALKRLSLRFGTTLFMTVLSGWAAVLSRLSGQDEVVIGVPSANRHRREIEPLLGFFVNTLALRIDLGTDPSVQELLTRVRRVALDAQEHQELPFEQVVELAHSPRRLDHAPVFQAMFAWQNNENSLLELADVQALPYPRPYEEAKIDLDLDLGEADGQIVGAFHYATALFDRSTIERHYGYLISMLKGMVASADRAVSRIEILSADERRSLLDTRNATSFPYPEDHCIQQLFEEQVQRTPEAPAVIFENEFFDYAQLNAKANRLAHYLMDCGVLPDSRVAICLERSLAMVVGMLAILKAGGAYVPLDPAYPAERLAQVLRDSRPVLLLSDAVGRTALGNEAISGVQDIQLDTMASSWARHPDSNPDTQIVGLTARHLAYVIYTSGSTGTPKGVAMPHRAVVNLINWQVAQAPPRRTLQFAALGFDVACQEVFSTLCAGSSLVLIPARMHSDFGNFIKVLCRQDIQRLFLPYVAAQSLAEALEDASEADIATLRNNLREVIVAGEQLRITPQINHFFKCLPECRLHNHYGPTESHVVTSYVLDVDRTHWPIHVPIGKPIANTRIYLLDRHGEPVPSGVIGELYIGGPAVARCYLDRPDLTQERFLPDPFSREVDARMYKTGDLSRYLPDGNLVFLERNDHQVKIRGFRIEVGEIEAKLAEHPAVREAAVIARENSAGGKRLIAYVIAQPHDDLIVSLREHLALRLPDYMIPATFVQLVALPLTPNGKLDRGALPEPDDDAYARHAYEPPKSATEQALAALWTTLLGVQRISRHDNFFELGGHSLLAVRLVSRISSGRGVALTLNTIFAFPTLSALARSIDEAPAHSKAEELPAIEPRAVSTDRLPLSFAQQHLWFLDQWDDFAATYNIPLAMRLRGPLNKSAWQQSLDALFARHEVLRSIFLVDEGRPYVYILEASQGLPVEELDVSDDPSVQLKDICAEESGKPFDLGRGPLIRVRLIRLGVHDHVFLLTHHHSIFDGWSIGIVMQELSVLYNAFASGAANPLPPLAIQYPDYAAWQRRWFGGERLGLQERYWHRVLSGAPIRLELPTDHPRPKHQSYAGAYVPLCIDAALTQALKSVSQKHGATLFMTLLAAWAVVLGRLSGQDDVVIGTPAAHRDRPEIEPLIGCFINPLALRMDLSGRPSVGQLLKRVRHVTLEAHDCQDIPFEQVVAALRPPRHMDHTPIFQVMFAWQNYEENLLDLAGLDCAPIETELQTVKFDLDLSFSEVDDGIVGTLGYATALFDHDTIERHCRYLINVLKGMVADVEQPVSEIEMREVECWQA